MMKVEKLKVTVCSCSGFSPPYEPSNILVDKTHDQTSRWSSDSNVPPQFVTLKLDRPAIVQTITFGKYEKSHVCNLKKFKVLGGLSEEKMSVLLESGLKNDSRPETFTLRHEIDGHCFPCRFLQILPVQSWGPSFNFSIWFVELNGITDWSIVGPCLEWYSTYRERLAVRLCLKHLRQLGCLDAFEALQKKTSVRLEDPRLTELHDALVLRSDFAESERVLERAMDDGLFGPFISSQEYVPQWTRISEPTDPTFPGPYDTLRPGMRGGHQMCIDVGMETVYLFGGWDGAQDLNDLWSYYIPNGEWNLISSNTALEGGPTPRSCHKMCLDTDSRQIFVLGRYLDTQTRTQENLKSDFHVYDIDNNQWTLISEDTSLVGGPKLVFDHQMCLDQLKKIIYVFGGRILTPSGTYTEAALANSTTFTVEHQFSGLYSYHIPTSTWRKLRDDPGVQAPVLTMRSRIGHSMLFHPVYRKLYIFGGQRYKEFLNDFFTYHVDSGEVEVITDGSRQDANQVPAAGFTQRSTIDPYRDEIHVLSGLSKEKDKREGDGVKNSFWVYDIKHNRWTCIYKNDRQERDYLVQSLSAPTSSLGVVLPSSKAVQEPCPRYAHQLVYDTNQGIHFLFGGNPGRATDPKMRLDDFWSLRLCRVSQSDVMRKCRFAVRRCRFQEMVTEDLRSALGYLQSAVGEVVDPENQEQTAEFHSLAGLLFRPTEASRNTATSAPTSSNDNARKRQGRIELYNLLVSFFPDYMTQPKADLVDLIPIDDM